jgi:hypothetical protein
MAMSSDGWAMTSTSAQQFRRTVMASGRPIAAPN